MSRQNNIKDFIGLKDVIVNKIEKNEKETEIHLEMEVKEQECPCCHEKTNRIHDYRIQRITDIPYQLKPVILVLWSFENVRKRIQKAIFKILSHLLQAFKEASFKASIAINRRAKATGVRYAFCLG